MPRSPETVLIDGRYRLEDVLGTGGAAVVRRAVDERLGRTVAVKLFHPGATEPERQTGELALMAGLAHPALVRMYDGGHTVDVNGADATYLVMEYVPGPTLRQALPLPPAEVAAIGEDLAAALAHLHARGIVHRDVKPANVLLPPDDGVHAKLGDFGVARLLDGSRVTATGMTVGTANYLSPEQVRGEHVGPPSDIYSLALVLLEALTGQMAYDGHGLPAALARLNRAATIPATLGHGWQSLLAAMLEPDPAARPDALQVRRRLHELDVPQTTAVLPTAGTATTVLPVGSPVSATAHRRRRRVPLLAWWTAALLGATGIVLAVIASTAGGGAATPGPAPSTTHAPAAASDPSSSPRSSTPTQVRAVETPSDQPAQRLPTPTPVQQGPGNGAGNGPGNGPGHGPGAKPKGHHGHP